MAKKKEPKKSDLSLLVDVGGNFTKAVQLGYAQDQPELSLIEQTIHTQDGLWPTYESADSPDFDLHKVFRLEEEHPAEQIAISTSRLARINLLLVGSKTEHLQEYLSFCNYLGIEAAGVLTKDTIRWSHEGMGIEQVDAVLLIGGFERKSTQQLLQLCGKLKKYFAFAEEKTIPIFYIGPEEIEQRVRSTLPQDQIFESIPELSTDKQLKNYLPLYQDLEQLRLQKALQQDWLLQGLNRNNVLDFESGTSALLSSVQLCTQYFQGNVLYIELGSQHGTVIWSHFQDQLQEVPDPILEQENILFQTEDYQANLYLGMQIFPSLGLGELHNGVKILEFEQRGISGRQQKREFKDRLFQSFLYNNTIPNQDEGEWHARYISLFLEQVWASLPRTYMPKHIIFGGGGLQADDVEGFLEQLILPARLPYTADIWSAQGSAMSLVGLMPKQGETRLTRSIMEHFLRHVCTHVRLRGRVGRKSLIAQVVVDTGSGDVNEYDVVEGEVTQVECHGVGESIVKIQPEPKAWVQGYAKEEEVILRTTGGERGVIIDSRDKR